MNLYGKSVDYARLMSWYGDDGKIYKFSGKIQRPNSWNNNAHLIQIRKNLESLYHDHLNSVLLNLYRNENDSISWHSDDEKELGLNPSIYSVTFGCQRIFKLKRKDKAKFADPIADTEIDLFGDKNQKLISSFNIPLKHNSLLIMKGETQKFWLHSIDKVKRMTSNGKKTASFKRIESDEFYPIRINLTFRNIKNHNK